MTTLDDPQHCASIVLWAHGCGGYAPGSFAEHLMAAWARADVSNQRRLATAFPTLADTIDEFRTGGKNALITRMEGEVHE